MLLLLIEKKLERICDVSRMARLFPAAIPLLAGLLSCFSSEMERYSTQRRQMPQRPNFYIEVAACRTVPGFTRLQLELCYRYPLEVAAALRGLQQAVKECHYQFYNYRWNCSSLSKASKNPYTSVIFQKGFRETAFAYAVSSAGVAISVAKSCSQGLLINCDCGTRKLNKKRTSWKWAGCSHNLQYGIKFSKIFFGIKDTGLDIHSAVNLHNSNVGRMAVFDNVKKKCKCHGLSGSCELKTCWKEVPNFHVVGKILKEKYESAIQVHQSNIANRNFQVIKSNKKKVKLKQWAPNKKTHKRNLRNRLLYYESSPNYCERDRSLDVWGTSGRICNLSRSDHSSCSSLCCGRGHNFVKRKQLRHCHCKFQWCCSVECQICNEEKWISVCK